MIVLIRIDERLIHGQVAVGWNGAVHPTNFIVIDDDIAAVDWETELVLAGIPDGTTGEVVTLETAIEQWETWRTDSERHLVLVAGPAPLVSLGEAGIVIAEVNVGGLHQRAGRSEFASYVHLDAAEILACQKLCEMGVRLDARDVPTARSIDICRRIMAKER